MVKAGPDRAREGHEQASRSRVLVCAQRAHPVLATVKDAQDRNDSAVGVLVHEVGDDSALLERGGPEAGADVAMGSAGQREGRKGLDVSANRGQEAFGDVGGCRPGDPVVDLVELALGAGL